MKVLILLLLLTFVGFSHGQTRPGGLKPRNIGPTCKKPLLDPNKPAVFLTFARYERIKPIDGSDDPDNLFFKLTNNTCWPIYVDMSGVADNRYGDATLYYLIEDKKSGEKKSGRLYCHVCSFNSIESRKSILFSLPLREVDRESLMKIRYDFKWEADSTHGDYESSNTIHTVTYNFSGLPDSVLPKT